MIQCGYGSSITREEVGTLDSVILGYHGLRMGKSYTFKGNQPKWLIDGVWYKADCAGTEALSEVVVSSLLSSTNFDNFIAYSPTDIICDGRKVTGCRCDDFLHNGEVLISLERLHRIYEGRSLAECMGKMPSLSERMQYMVSFVESVTGLNGFGFYLAKVLTIDAFFLNEDRHTNNLDVIYNEYTGRYRLCPVFDNGLSLLSDIYNYSLEEDVYKCIDAVQAKPFSTSFVEQVEVADSLYSNGIEFYFSKKDVWDVVKSLGEYYDRKVLARTINVIFEQMRKYSYLMSRRP